MSVVEQQLINCTVYSDISRAVLYTLGWVDIGIGARVPLNVVVYL
jgi:hypothetical protein